MTGERTRTGLFLSGESRLDGFALATVVVDGKPEPGLVLGEEVFDLRHCARQAEVDLAEGDPRFDIRDLLDQWDASFAGIASIVNFIDKIGVDDERLHTYGPGSRIIQPVARPSKMIYAAQNYPDHVQEMRDARKFGFNDVVVDAASDFKGDRSTSIPYLFLKAPSCLTGPYDDVAMPPEVTKMDWEVELAVVIGRRATRVSAAEAPSHIAGFMTTNDFSARNLLFRPDRDRLRSDWFGGKSHDGFAPMGPLFVPAEFVPDPSNLRLRLSVNGITRQDGNTGHLIFSPAEQIEYASRFTTLSPGDIFATGTPGGVGQGSDTFLTPGDVVEAEVVGLGVLRNRIVVSAA
ncbi:MAG: fumarylacetoacetate hydrolase family protein [Actinomycetota bacterium]|nr:fumarylacetoacetate hydrolase family protein [Actinomycetota bacterium]